MQMRNWTVPAMDGGGRCVLQGAAMSGMSCCDDGGVPDRCAGAVDCGLDHEGPMRAAFSA